jgi:hypothetical protein
VAGGARRIEHVAADRARGQGGVGGERGDRRFVSSKPGGRFEAPASTKTGRSSAWASAARTASTSGNMAGDAISSFARNPSARRPLPPGSGAC